MLALKSSIGALGLFPERLRVKMRDVAMPNCWGSCCSVCDVLNYNYGNYI